MGRIVASITVKNALTEKAAVRCDAAVDMLGQRLVPVKHLDLK